MYINPSKVSHIVVTRRFPRSMRKTLARITNSCSSSGETEAIVSVLLSRGTRHKTKLEIDTATLIRAGDKTELGKASPGLQSGLARETPPPVCAKRYVSR